MFGHFNIVDSTLVSVRDDFTLPRGPALKVAIRNGNLSVLNALLIADAQLDLRGDVDIALLSAGRSNSDAGVAQRPL